MAKTKYTIGSKELYRLYSVDKLTCAQIATIYKCCQGTILYRLRGLAIRRRTHSERIKLAYAIGTLDRKGDKCPKWKGGRTVGKRGYVSIYVDPSSSYHSMCVKGQNYVAEHRLVMAQHLGRPLLSCEIVHHINGVKGDNRIENLELMTASDHQPINRKCTGCKIKLDLRKAYARIKELENLAQRRLL